MSEFLSCTREIAVTCVHTVLISRYSPLFEDFSQERCAYLTGVVLMAKQLSLGLFIAVGGAGTLGCNIEIFAIIALCFITAGMRVRVHKHACARAGKDTMGSLWQGFCSGVGLSQTMLAAPSTCSHTSASSFLLCSSLRQHTVLATRRCCLAQRCSSLP